MRNKNYRIVENLKPGLLKNWFFQQTGNRLLENVRYFDILVDIHMRVSTCKKHSFDCSVQIEHRLAFHHMVRAALLTSSFCMHEHYPANSNNVLNGVIQFMMKWAEPCTYFFVFIFVHEDILCSILGTIHKWRSSSKYE